MLGADDSNDPELMKEMRQAVQQLCQRTWKLYQSSGDEKIAEAKVLLLERATDAQYIGLEGATVQMMRNEVSRLFDAGD